MRDDRIEPPNQSQITPTPAPARTDMATEDCLRSSSEQEYNGRVQVLFGVAAAEDPVCSVIQKMFQEYPASDADVRVAPDCLANVGSLVGSGRINENCGRELLEIAVVD